MALCASDFMKVGIGFQENFRPTEGFSIFSIYDRVGIGNFPYFRFQLGRKSKKSKYLGWVKIFLEIRFRLCEIQSVSKAQGLLMLAEKRVCFFLNSSLQHEKQSLLSLLQITQLINGATSLTPVWIFGVTLRSAYR